MLLAGWCRRRFGLPIMEFVLVTKRFYPVWHGSPLMNTNGVMAGSQRLGLSSGPAKVASHQAVDKSFGFDGDRSSIG